MKFSPYGKYSEMPVSGLEFKTISVDVERYMKVKKYLKEFLHEFLKEQKDELRANKSEIIEDKKEMIE